MRNCMRLAKRPESKAKSVTFSLSQEHIKMLDDITLKLKRKRSYVVQAWIEEKYNNLIKG